MDLEQEIFEDAEEALPDEIRNMTTDEIIQRWRLLDNEIRVFIILVQVSQCLRLAELQQAYAAFTLIC